MPSWNAVARFDEVWRTAAESGASYLLITQIRTPALAKPRIRHALQALALGKAGSQSVVPVRQDLFPIVRAVVTFVKVTPLLAEVKTVGSSPERFKSARIPLVTSPSEFKVHDVYSMLQMQELNEEATSPMSVRDVIRDTGHEMFPTTHDKELDAVSADIERVIQAGPSAVRETLGREIAALAATAGRHDSNPGTLE